MHRGLDTFVPRDVVHFSDDSAAPLAGLCGALVVRDRGDNFSPSNAPVERSDDENCTTCTSEPETASRDGTALAALEAVCAVMYRGCEALAGHASAKFPTSSSWRETVLFAREARWGLRLLACLRSTALEGVEVCLLVPTFAVNDYVCFAESLWYTL